MSLGSAFETEPVTTEGDTALPRAPKQPTLAAGICALVVVTGFLWMIHNRYLPIVEDWFSSYAQLMHEGKLPYRDFYFFTQPLSLLFAWAVYGVSDKMIYLRYFGMGERVLLTGCLYFLLSRRFSPAASFWATVVSMLVFLSYVTEAFFTYLVTSCLFLVVSLVFLQVGLNRSRDSKWFLFLSGVSASLSFLSKQSNGLFVTVAVVFLAAVLTRSETGQRWKRGSRQALAVISGWVVPELGLAVWLHHYGLTDVYLQQVFHGAAASKGGLTKIFSAFLVRAITPATGIALVIAAFVLWRMRRRGWKWLPVRSHPLPTPQSQQLGWILVAATAAAAAVLCGYFLPYNIFGIFFARTSALLIARVVFWGSLIASTVWLTKLLRGTWGPDTLVPMFVVAGFTWAYACGLSWDVQQQGTLLLMGLILAIGYDAFSSLRARTRFIAFLVGFTCFVTWHKCQIAFEWDGWRESISHTPISSHWPRLAGYRTDPRLMGMFDAILDDVAEFSKPGEPVFTFPFMPMFNFVPNRPQPTFAVVHYWDVCPDWVAKADAERVRRARPRVIVEMEFSEEVWRLHELGFRANGLSGQRAITKVIDELVSSGDYILQENFASPGYGDPIRVWVRVR